MSDELLSLLGEIDQDQLAIKFELQPMPSNSDAIQVLVADQEEFPINITKADSELICMVKLFEESEIKDGAKGEMHEIMLSANLALPLSRFGKIGSTYMLFGALSAESKIESISLEVETLAGNTLEALELVAEHLK